MSTGRYKKLKVKKATMRIALARKARRSPTAARVIQKRVSLVGDGAKWKITNLSEVARAIAKWP